MEGFDTILFFIAFTFFPTFLAFLRRHPHLRAIFFFNLFLGFGWGLFGTYYYALSKRKPGVKAWIIFAILNAIIIAIAVPSLLSARRHSNDALARSNMTKLWSEFEHYAKNHDGQYPPNLSSLTASDDEEIRDLCGKTISRYAYDCSLSEEGYRVIASPESDDYGNMTFTLTTGGVLSVDWFNEFMEDKITSLEKE